MEIITTLSHEFSEKELEQIRRTLESDGFELLIRFIKEQAASKSAEAINSIPESHIEQGMINSVLSSTQEARYLRKCFEILNNIRLGEVELTHTEVKI